MPSSPVHMYSSSLQSWLLRQSKYRSAIKIPRSTTTQRKCNIHILIRDNEVTITLHRLLLAKGPLSHSHMEKDKIRGESFLNLALNLKQVKKKQQQQDTLQQRQQKHGTLAEEQTITLHLLLSSVLIVKVHTYVHIYILHVHLFAKICYQCP